MAISLKVEQLWAFADGTICLIVEREDEPRYEVCVMRGERVLHQDRRIFDRRPGAPFCSPPRR